MCQVTDVIDCNTGEVVGNCRSSPTRICLYLRGSPGTGKRTVADILERDWGWPVIWVHAFDAIYKAIGEYKVPDLTDKLIRDVASHLMSRKRDFIIVRPSRTAWGIENIKQAAKWYHCKLIVVTLTADTETLYTRVTRRWHESPFRLTTREALDEYLGERKGEAFDGEHTIDTTNLTPEEVAARVKELL